MFVFLFVFINLCSNHGKMCRFLFFCFLFFVFRFLCSLFNFLIF